MAWSLTIINHLTVKLISSIKIIIIILFFYFNNGVVMIKKPVSPNCDHSNRFLTDYIPQTLHSLVPMLPHQEPRNRLLWSHFVFIAEYYSKKLKKYFVRRGVLNMIEI